MEIHKKCRFEWKKYGNICMGKSTKKEGLNGKMTEVNGGFSSAMFEYRRVTPATGEISWRSMFHKMHRNNTKDTKGRRMD
jgi:hypothetical protein